MRNSVLDQLKARGEELFGRGSAELMANPNFMRAMETAWKGKARIDEATGKRTLCVMSAIDNLIKGGAGQAVQCFNLMTGADEYRGLDVPGLWP